jgi:hypothetical protein
MEPNHSHLATGSIDHVVTPTHSADVRFANDRQAALYHLGKNLAFNFRKGLTDLNLSALKGFKTNYPAYAADMTPKELTETARRTLLDIRDQVGQSISTYVHLVDWAASTSSLQSRDNSARRSRVIRHTFEPISTPSAESVAAEAFDLQRTSPRGAVLTAYDARQEMSTNAIKKGRKDAKRKKGGSVPPKEPEPVGNRRFSTVVEVEEHVRSLGVDGAFFTDNLHIGEMVAEVLDELTQKGYPVPDGIGITDDQLLHALFKPEDLPDLIAAYSGVFNTVFINPHHTHWSQGGQNAASVMKEAYRKGNFSTSHIYHPILHEFGHFLHWKLDKAKYESLRNEFIPIQVAIDIGSGVSNYAFESPLELVAEMWVAMYTGRKLSDKAMKWYHYYGGPDL